MNKTFLALLLISSQLLHSSTTSLLEPTKCRFKINNTWITAYARTNPLTEIENQMSWLVKKPKTDGVYTKLLTNFPPHSPTSSLISDIISYHGIDDTERKEVLQGRMLTAISGIPGHPETEKAQIDRTVVMPIEINTHVCWATVSARDILQSEKSPLEKLLDDQIKRTKTHCCILCWKNLYLSCKTCK